MSINENKLRVIEEEFFEGKAPYWKMYKDKSKKKVVAFNDDEGDLGVSFDLLIHRANNAKVMEPSLQQVYVYTRQTIGNNPNVKELVISFDRRSQLAGIQGPSNQGKYTQHELDLAIERALREKNLEDQIAGLQEAVEENTYGSGFMKMITSFCKEQPEIAIAYAPHVGGLISKIVSPFIASKAQVQMNGFPPDEKQVVNPTGIELSLSRIQKVFPNLEIFLDALANYIETNPEMAKSLFNQSSTKDER